MLFLWLPDGDVANVFDLAAQLLQPRLQTATRRADGPMSNTAAGLRLNPWARR